MTMTKRQIVGMLQHWPDDTVVEVSIPDAAVASVGSDRVWRELVDEEMPKRSGPNPHCLLVAGKITKY